MEKSIIFSTLLNNLVFYEKNVLSFLPLRMQGNDNNCIIFQHKFIMQQLYYLLYWLEKFL